MTEESCLFETEQKSLMKNREGFAKRLLEGERRVLEYASCDYPELLRHIEKPPRRLYCIGNLAALKPGIAIIGARKASDYGLDTTYQLARVVGEYKVPIISGGAYGCDAQAHRGSLDSRSPGVVVLGGGCDCVYPACHFSLFQNIISEGGIVVSEYPWDKAPLPFQFRARNRIIAGLARALLIIEAGYPSGTFSTADAALFGQRDVWVVPGNINSPSSHGSNMLIHQGAYPIVNKEVLRDQIEYLFDLFELRSCSDKSLDVIAHIDDECADRERNKREDCEPKPNESSSLTKIEQYILDCLAQKSLSLDELCGDYYNHKTYSLSDLSLACLQLESKAQIKRTQFGEYCIASRGSF